MELKGSIVELDENARLSVMLTGGRRWGALAWAERAEDRAGKSWAGRMTVTLGPVAMVLVVVKEGFVRQKGTLITTGGTTGRYTLNLPKA